MSQTNLLSMESRADIKEEYQCSVTQHNQGCAYDVNAINKQNNKTTKSNPTSSTIDGLIKSKSNNINKTKTKKKTKKDQLHKPNIQSKFINTKTTSLSNEEKSAEISASENKENVVDINRDHLNLVLIGHVDHGKSTIAGQILLSSNSYIHHIYHMTIN